MYIYVETQGAILLGNKISPSFRKFITPAGKVGFVVMAGMGTFVLKTQHNLTRIHRSRAWKKETSAKTVVQSTNIGSTSFYDKSIDFLAQKHFYVLGASFGIALPSHQRRRTSQ